jgi:uncharacterized paraquat-inducible protein A
MRDHIICKICGSVYRWFSMTVADQSMCPDCHAELERRRDAPTEAEDNEAARRRAKYFGSKYK